MRLQLEIPGISAETLTSRIRLILKSDHIGGSRWDTKEEHL